MKLIAFWFKNSRPHALPQSLLPAIMTFFLAMMSEGFSFWLGLLAVFGVMMGHLGLNLFDDYFDYRKKSQDYREAMVHEGFRARISKCNYLKNGDATIEELLVACCIFCGLALIAGLVILHFRGIIVFYFALAAALLGIFYSAPPFRLSYHGLGEVVIALMFGPLAMNGVYYATCGTFSPTILYFSVPVGLLVCNVVYVHSILDVEPDKKVGKKTLAVLLGSKRNMLAALAIILFTPFLFLIAIIFLPFIRGDKAFSFYSLSAFTTFLICLPIAISLFNSVKKFTVDPQFIPERKKWMGPMQNWDRIVASGTDWFMIRWYLARNLLTAFCLISIVVSLTSYVLILFFLIFNWK